MNTSRCCYSKFYGRVVITDIEWVAEGVEPTAGAKISERVVRALLTKDIQELNRQTAEEMLPEHLKIIGAPVLDMLEGMQQLAALIVSPIRTNGEMSAVMAFDICKERAHLANWPQNKLDFVSGLCKMLEAELQRRAV